jgi:hypothetical protein
LLPPSCQAETDEVNSAPLTEDILIVKVAVLLSLLYVKELDGFEKN